MSTELALEHPPTYNPLAVLEKAIDSGVDADRLGRLMELQREWSKDRAAEAFANALAEFQRRMPIIKKDREAGWEEKGSGQYKKSYMFASYDDIMRVARPLFAECGIVVTFTSEPAQTGMKITCRVRVGIHMEETTLTLPLPANMKVNDTQKAGAALSYLKRYALCEALNIVVSDEDDDAATQTPAVDYITGEQIATLNTLLERTGTDLKKFLEWKNLPSLGEMPAGLFEEALRALKRKAAKIAADGARVPKISAATHTAIVSALSKHNIPADSLLDWLRAHHCGGLVGIADIPASLGDVAMRFSRMELEHEELHGYVPATKGDAYEGDNHAAE